MVERKRKKKNKLRANRTMGKGNTKNNRGGGSRGGRGRGGSKKHKRQLFLHEVGALRKLKPKKKGLALNLFDVNKRLEAIAGQKDAIKEEGMIVFDGKKERVKKILSTGKILQKAFFKNVLASAKAVEKIEEQGGKIDSAEKKTPDAQKDVTGENEE